MEKNINKQKLFKIYIIWETPHLQDSISSWTNHIRFENKIIIIIKNPIWRSNQEMMMMMMMITLWLEEVRKNTEAFLGRRRRLQQIWFDRNDIVFVGLHSHRNRVIFCGRFWVYYIVCSKRRLIKRRRWRTHSLASMIIYINKII